ncbi:hypothetical protein HMPREF1531_00518 [Propionibacterium sp. oral taxon 192 str. F0372]|uniref:peptide ABC transporter substrate-binding protein n=1 Tax=Propionibacterium sp. oral taxon 192 TaxID=671222 RepID=UPI0003532D09|nr:ABC transporter substrate-binding protein [Propionibacterium sp. oral taxon 192]EPH06617.1 hypothetical protein HMPREF1531_00518 [Propionibacterium sp. oral taxon 192 str. F0372]
MRKQFRVAAATSAAVLALAMTACGSGSGGSGESTGITVRGCTPKNSLIPGNTTETCGGNMLEAITSQLIRYNTETSAPEMDIAESIETSDNVHFTVKLKQGYKFHDGTEVKAENFVKAWNYTAAYANGQGGASFMSVFKGADVIGAEGATATEMDGLKVVDDYTFTIETATPVSNLPIRLGYTAFSPLPDSFFADPEAYGKMPVGSGPFKFVSGDNQQYVLEKFADYSGPEAAKVDSITFRVYTDSQAAYNDVVANQLDFTDEIPSSFLVDNQFQSQLGDRSMQRETLRYAGLVFSPNDPQLASNLKLRQAISKSIDRQLVTEQILNGAAKPAHGWAPKTVNGATDTACGEFCDYDPEAAKALYDESGGYSGTLTITVNGDASHRDWAEAVCNSIRGAIGLDCVVVATPNFDEYQKQIKDRTVMGLMRQGWQGDYPSIENFLAPLYQTGGESNWARYSNPEFEALLTQAAAASTEEEANKLYGEAEAKLAADLPTTPLWYPMTSVGWSNRLENVAVNAFGGLDYSAVKVK